jgi:anti-sigma-K factor RskA
MNTFSIRFVALSAVAALALAVAFVPAARSQIQTTPNFIPMGVAAAGAASMAWFHEPSSGRAMVCQSAAGTSSAASPTPIQCVTVKLPRAEP